MLIVWRLDFDLNKAFGRSFYRLRVTNAFVVTHAVASGFTDSTNTLINPSPETHSITYVTNVPIKMWGFKTDEYTILSVSQGANTQILGFFRFADVPAFDEASFPKIFIARTPDLASVGCTGLSPYGTTTSFATSLGNTQLTNADSYLQRRSLLTGFLLYVPGEGGILGRSSDDLGMGACFGMVRGDTFENPNAPTPETFLLLRPGAGALLIKI
jgi:hypothetical protein